MLKFLKSLLADSPADPAERIAALNAEVRTKLKAGDRDGALASAAQATSAALDAYGAGASDYAIALVDEGFLHFVLGRNDSARNLYRRATPIFVSHKQGVPYFFQPVMDRARQHASAGEFEPCLGMLSALEEMYRLGGLEESDEHAQLRVLTARVLNARGIARKQAGDIPGALASYREAIEAADGDEVTRATALNNMGIAYGAVGDPGRAVPLLAEAAGLRRKLLGDADQNTRATLFNLADAQAGVGDYPAAAGTLALWVAGDPDMSRQGSLSAIALNTADEAMQDGRSTDAIAFTGCCRSLKTDQQNEVLLAEN